MGSFLLTLQNTTKLEQNMSRSSNSAHLCHPFLRTLSTRMATMLGLGGPEAMKVVAALTSAQSESDRMTPTLFSYSNLVHAVSGAVVSVN